MFMIGKRTFPEYTMKRLIKDRIGFYPAEKWENSYTDCKALIHAPLAENSKDFLVYCHELGHCKSYQPPQKQHVSWIDGQWCNGRIEGEFNAWIWALRYFRRLGFSLTKEHTDLIKYCLNGYCKEAISKSFCKSQAIRFYNKCGIRIKVGEELQITINTGVPKYLNLPSNNKYWEDLFADKFKGFKYESTTVLKGSEYKKPLVDKPKNWKPWHDLKSNQIKRQWRNQR